MTERNDDDISEAHGRCATVTVLRDGIKTLINRSDFDPKVDEEVEPDEIVEPAVTVLRDGVEVVIKKADLVDTDVLVEDELSGDRGDDLLKLLDGSIPDIIEAIKTIENVDEIDALIEAETNGNTRSGAINVLEDRKAAIGADTEPE